VVWAVVVTVLPMALPSRSLWVFSPAVGALCVAVGMAAGCRTWAAVPQRLWSRAPVSEWPKSLDAGLLALSLGHVEGSRRWRGCGLIHAYEEPAVALLGGILEC